jgi:transposase
MSRFLPYRPDQAYLLPPNVKDELGSDHLCFFLHDVVEWLDRSAFEQGYSEEGGALYEPSLMLKVWLYGYALGITSARRLEQRIREDLALRYLAGGAKPDNWALSAFRRRHARALNDAFTQVLELARRWKLGKLGTVAVDSTRIRAHASRDRIDTEQRLRNERARLRRQVRHWQQQCNQEDGDEGAGCRLPAEKLEQMEQQLASLPRRLERLRKSGASRLSRTDPEARLLRARDGFVLGYTAEIAVSDDHLIVAQRVTQAAADNHSLLPLAERGIDAYVPDSNLARALNRGEPLRVGQVQQHHPQLRAMRRKLQSPAGRKVYERRKAIVEPVFGSLKQQRGMRQFRTRSLAKVAAEFSLATLAYNLTRLYTMM